MAKNEEPSSTALVRCLAKVSGKIHRARGLMNTKVFGKSAARCYVKGIKGNSHLVTFFCTDVAEGNNPHWDADWEYDCLKTRTRDEFVGLKFVVYDGDEFLGGTDFDLSEIATYQEVNEELELTGVVMHKAKGYQPKKARLFISCSVERRMLPMFGHPQKMLMSNMRSIMGVTSICGRIVRARGLKGKEDHHENKRSWPMCFVRCYMNSGRVIELFNTKANKMVHEPNWNESFEFDFEDLLADSEDQPLVLIFDIIGTAGMSRNDARKIFNHGDYCGSAMMSVDAVQDEDAFLKGMGRHRLRLMSIDECQRIESRLDKDGKRAETNDAQDKSKKTPEAAANKQEATIRERVSERMSGMMDYFRGAKEEEKAFHLTVELFAERAPRPMPYSELLGESKTVERTENIKEEDPSLASFFAMERDDGAEVKRLNVTAEERITSIYGRVIGGCDLISSDVSGKSDPYVIVEAITKDTTKYFIYRTRVQKSNLNPEWGEYFFFQVPPDPQLPQTSAIISKVHFSIYDSDEGQTLEALTGEEGDDFLGSTGVNVTTMRNCDCMIEEVPLLGVKTRPGGYKCTTSFRRYSTVAVELRVERRVQRIVDPQHEFDPELLYVPRHLESRPMHPPEFKGYRDLSQLIALGDPGALAVTAKTVLDLKESNKLADVAKYQSTKVVGGAGWLAVKTIPTTWKKPDNVETEEQKPAGSLFSESDHRKAAEPRQFRRDWRALAESWDQKLNDARANIRNMDHVNRLPPMIHVGSTPTLETRFGLNYEKNIMDPFEEHARRLRNQKPQEFLRNAGPDDVVKSIAKKPLPEDWSNRSLRRKTNSPILNDLRKTVSTSVL